MVLVPQRADDPERAGMVPDHGPLVVHDTAPVAGEPPPGGYGVQISPRIDPIPARHVNRRLDGGSLGREPRTGSTAAPACSRGKERWRGRLAGRAMLRQPSQRR